MGHPEQVDVIVCGGGPAGISSQPCLFYFILILMFFVFCFCFFTLTAQKRMCHCGSSRLCWSKFNSDAHRRYLIFIFHLCFQKNTHTQRRCEWIGGENNRDDPWVYRPGIFVRNMQKDGMCVFSPSLSLSLSVYVWCWWWAFESNDKATFYTDTEKSSFLRGRRSIVPYVSIALFFSRASANLRYVFFRCANILGGGSRWVKTYISCVCKYPWS